MTAKIDIFLLTGDKDTIVQVQSVSQNGSPIRLGGVFSEPADLKSYLEKTEIQAGIFDIDPDPERRLNCLETLMREHPKLCAIVVSKTMSQNLILSAMQAGARHFLQKSTLNKELGGVMGKLLQHMGLKRATGSVLTVFSSSGGCGATTVALNMAMELRLTSQKPVLMIDLDRCYGAASAYLDIESDYGIADVLTHDGKIDKHLIQSSSASYMENFHVLLSPAGISNSRVKTMKTGNLKNVLEACREAYAYTVIDAPRLDDETVNELAELSDFTIVVFQLTIKDLKFARSMISSFKQRGQMDKVIPLANRFQKRSRLVAVESGKQALGSDQMVLIRSDWRSAMNCLNKGKTLAEAAPRSGMRKDFLKLISRIHRSDNEG
ncbi:MAG: AAA family ATPase [Planctomycetaceae bacterium]|nr:AAA family ATPase [Planctomycetaceae bacterium]